jgi:hypothetical protein
MNYILDTIWHMPFYIYGLVVCSTPTQVTASYSLSNSASIGFAWIPFHFRAVIVAGSTLSLRAFPTSPHCPCCYVIRRSLVSLEKSPAAAGTIGNSHSLGSGCMFLQRLSRLYGYHTDLYTACQQTWNSDLEKLRQAAHDCDCGSPSRLGCACRCRCLPSMEFPSWSIHVSLHALSGSLDLSSIYSCLVIRRHKYFEHG